MSSKANMGAGISGITGRKVSLESRTGISIEAGRNPSKQPSQLEPV